MAKKPHVLPNPQNALNKFMVRILFERDQLDRAYNLDGNTISIFKVKPNSGTRQDSDDVGGLVDSHLEDKYHSLYGETPELPKMIEATKTECCMVDANFAGILIPPLNAMVKVHRSCIEDLRNGKGWNWETHSEAFEELKQLSGAYASKLIKMTANTDDKPMVESVGETMPKVVMGRVKKKLRSKKLQGKKLESDIPFSSAITDHHQYEKGSKKSGTSCLNFEPISCEELGRKAKLGINSASKFIRKWLGTYKDYVAHCRDKSIIVDLQLLNNEATSRFNINLDAEKIGVYDPEPDFPL